MIEAIQFFIDPIQMELSNKNESCTEVNTSSMRRLVLTFQQWNLLSKEERLNEKYSSP
jgi:hypothetical protein